MNTLVIRAATGKGAMTYRDVKNALKRAEQMGVDLDAPIKADIMPFDVAGAFAGLGSSIVAIKIPLKEDEVDDDTDA
jgi:hypothetical protein